MLNLRVEISYSFVKLEWNQYIHWRFVTIQNHARKVEEWDIIDI